MKKVVLGFLLMFFIVSVSAAASGKYQIYSERKGFLGLAGKRVILLDTDTGDTWLYNNDRWEPVLKAAEVPPPESEVKAQIEDEMSQLKARQEEETKALKLRQAEEIKSLMEKKEIKVKTEVQPVRRYYRAARVAKKKSPPSTIAKESESEEAPPSWLSD